MPLLPVMRLWRGQLRRLSNTSEKLASYFRTEKKGISARAIPTGLAHLAAKESALTPTNKKDQYIAQKQK